MIIGGMSLYQQALPVADRLYMTVVDAEFEGDTWFPQFNRENWTEVEKLVHETDDKNAYRCIFTILERKSK
jgi:dihydrofolate reductase